MYHLNFKCKIVLIIKQSVESAHFLFTFFWANNTDWCKQALGIALKIGVTDIPPHLPVTALHKPYTVE